MKSIVRRIAAALFALPLAIIAYGAAWPSLSRPTLRRPP